jgi:hypothetical protein
MGQDIMQYTTGVQGLGRNQERGPFRIDDDDNLVFGSANGGTAGFQACLDAAGGAYSVWLAGATNPGGNGGCIGSARGREGRRSRFSAWIRSEWRCREQRS